MLLAHVQVADPRIESLSTFYLTVQKNCSKKGAISSTASCSRQRLPCGRGSPLPHQGIYAADANVTRKMPHAYWYKHTIDCGVAGCRHSGHSGFVWHQPMMQSQQNRCPHGVAAAFCLLDMHREQRRRDGGKRAAFVASPSDATAGTRWGGGSCERVGHFERGDGVMRGQSHDPPGTTRRVLFLARAFRATTWNASKLIRSADGTRSSISWSGENLNKEGVIKAQF